MNFVIWQLFVIIYPTGVYSWDSQQLEVFDVVEEIQQNFYDLLGISQEADISQIKSAYRKLSLILHPDKNPNDDAAVKFRQLVSVYDILRNQEKRKYYHEVLENGLPDWRSAVYYYRRAKKVTLVELSIFLFVIISFGQYVVSWASYAEMKYTLEVNKRGKQKRMPTEDIPKPSILNTLPIQLPILIWKLITLTPSLIKFLSAKIIEIINTKRKIEESEESSDDHVEIAKPQRRKYIQELPEFSGVETSGLNIKTENTKCDSALKDVKQGPWSDEDMSELSKLIKKFPGGTPGRWELIAEAMNRSVDDVTKVMKSIRQNSYKVGVAGSTDKKFLEKIRPQSTNVENVWTQQQQQALEIALQAFPKTLADRWDKISENVPNKSKEECIVRYKLLVETVKNRKEKSK